MPRQSYAFRVGAIAPTGDPAWHSAGESVHRAFWGAVVGFVITEKNRELAEGLDIFGDPLTPIAESTRRKGRWRSYTGHGTADAPPLTPAGALSRTRSLFTGRAHADHAEFFWRYDAVSGQHWGRILGFHRDGAGLLPERDVIGLSPQSLANVERKARQWWEDWKAGRAHADRAAQLSLLLPPVPSGRPSFVRPVAGAHFDLDRFTFGIGGSREQVASAMARGTSTGFRQLPPRGPAPRAPAAVPRPSAPPRPPFGRPAMPPGRVAASPRADYSMKPPLRPKPALASAPVPGAAGTPPAGPPASIQRAQAVAQKYGVPIDPAGSKRTVATHGADAHKIPCWFDYDTSEIVINETHRSWADPAKFMAAMRAQKWFSTSHPDHLIYHEVAHGLHYRQIGDANTIKLQSAHFTQQEAAVVSRDLSDYATDNFTEFVAEAFAAQALDPGRPLDPQIKKWYAKFQGPHP